MPANLSPEYKAAELHYRQARDPKERLQWLREMLRVIPKHKGTDHLQGDIKRRIKSLSEEVESSSRHGGARSAPAIFIRSEGAAQLGLIGPPNSGKSSLHAKLTGSNVHVAPYPFTTQYPEPGMMPYLDIAFQLIDLPPIAPEHQLPWIADALQGADGCLLVIDLSDAACVEQVQAVRDVLQQRHVSLTECWDPGAEERAEDDPFALCLPTLLLDNKADRLGNPEEDLEVFRELTGVRYPALAVSAVSGVGLGEIGPFLFNGLHIVRAYTKMPGHPPDRDRPFTLRHGQTVGDVARLVHPDLVRTLRYARVWGKSGFDGQHVGLDHRIEDGEVIELHG
jgi:ribosome-interacting GTPase 1